MDELCIRRRARLDPDAPALLTEARDWSWSELAHASLAAVSALRIAPGERIALSAGNSAALVIVIMGLLDRQHPFTLLHPRLTDTERDAQIHTAGATRVLTGADLEALITDLDHRTPSGAPLSAPEPLAAMLFTSGTSGVAKAAMLPRASLIASARASAAHLGAATLARWLVSLPICHVGGLSALTRALVLGGCLVLEPQLDAAALVPLALRRAITGTSLVPTQLRRVLRAHQGDLAMLGTVMVGGAAASPDLLAESQLRKLDALCTYGLTETCSQVTLELPANQRATLRSNGVPLGDNRIVVLDTDGVAMAPGEVGSVHVQGPSLFAGYLGLPAPSLPFCTGDLGWIDAHGGLHIESRRTDLVVSGGENVYPLEVERALLAPGLLDDTLVFGLADAEWGQVVTALLVPRNGAELTDLTVRRLADSLGDTLASFKHPKRYAVLDQLPLGPSGKVERRRAADVARDYRPWPRRSSA